MHLVDRFMCRREGHVPAHVITHVSGVKITSYITTCVRCGKQIEIKRDESEADVEIRG